MYEFLKICRKVTENPSLSLIANRTLTARRYSSANDGGGLYPPSRAMWNTVPKVPMSFTVESSNLPLNGPFSGRIFLKAGYRFHRHFAANLWVGYGSRDFGIGGPVAGLDTQFEF